MSKIKFNKPSRPRRVRTPVQALLFASLVAAGACSFDVSQPGRAEDQTLDDPAAYPPLVAGMSQRLSHALWQTAFITAETSREYIEGGRIFTTKLTSVPGTLTREAGGTVPFANAVQARWVAEDGIRRFRANIADAEKSPLLAQALVHAGFANRLLGETHCESVFDAGAAGSSNIYFERALKHFTEAIAVATAAGRADLATAALAGRASVKVGLKDWSGAAADAANIPLAFKYQAKYTATELDQYNILYWANANSPFRTFSVVGTYFEGYFRDTGDPRVAWGTDPKTPNAELSSVKWLFPQKYRAVTDPINLVTGREARLIEAEASLRSGQTADALARINALRATVTSASTGAPLTPWPSTADATTVWRYLKLERGIELYLEGRRIGDLRRWSEDDSPAKDVVDVRDRIRLCIPLSAAELNTNPNLDPNHVDPVNPLYVAR
jgi:hypothetical protein